MRYRLTSFLAVLGLVALCCVPSAAAATAAAAPPGPGIASLPFLVEGGASDGSLGGLGSPALNGAVSTVCNQGQALGSPQWFTLPAGDLGSVYAVGRAVYYPRGMTTLRSGVAFVDHESNTVLGCGSSPVQVTASHAGAVVLYFDPAELASCRDTTSCGEPRASLHVGRSSGVPGNDTTAQPRRIPSLPYTGAGDSALADSDGPSPVDLSCAKSMISPSQRSTVWWTFTAAASGVVPMTVDAETYGTPERARTFAPVVGLVQQTAAGLVRVPRPKDQYDCESGPFSVQAGQTYLVGVASVRDSYYGGPLVEGGRFDLHVGSIGAPAAPAEVRVSQAAPGSVAVTWDPPAPVPGAPVEAYEVTRDGTAADGTGPTTARVPAATRSQAFSGLTPGATYRFSVRALSAAGTGVPATVTRTLALPGQPVTGAAPQGDLASRTATVTWQPPASDGGLPVTGYRVSRNGVDDGGGGPWSTVVSAGTRSFTFSQLRLAVGYTLSVTAINAAGPGPAARLSVQLGRLASWATDVTATSDADTRSATLTWSPPSDDGGLPVTGYLVARDGTDSGGAGPWSRTVPATARSQTFTSLLVGQGYSLSVRPITEAGPGRQSSAFTQLTPTRSAGYLPLDPRRVLDTRSGLGAPAPSKLGPGGTITLQVTGPAGTGLAPVGSTAVALNVTATGATASSYVSVFPAGFGDGPRSSNLNVVAGRTVPNLVISKVSAQGTVTFYNDAGSVDLVADLQGAFRPDPATSTYLPSDPQRLLDSRTGLGQGTAAKLAAGGRLRLQVTGAGRAPLGATAVVLNVTVTNATADSHLSVFPTGSATGTSSSNLNVAAGQTIPNLVVSKVADDGSVTIYNDSGSVDVIADLQGAFVSGTVGQSYRPSNPRRVLDTRVGLGVATVAKLGPRQTVTLRVTGDPGSGLAPVGSTAVVLNVTATNATSSSYVSVYPTGFAGGASSSNLNVVPGRTAPNLVISKVGAGGTVTLYNDAGSTDLIADLQGAYGSGAPGTAAGARAVDEPV